MVPSARTGGIGVAVQQGGWHDPRPEGTGLGFTLGYRNIGGEKSGAAVTVGGDGRIEVLTKR